MKLLMSIVAVFSLLYLPILAEAFSTKYQCTSEVETTVGYSPRSEKIEYSADRVKRSATVRLSGMEGDNPVLHAQRTVALTKLVEGRRTISLSEMTSGGTVVIWTLFEGDGSRPPTLISTKSYNLFGAVSFTAFYKCK